jgi:arginyl-tRNA synthetase
MAAAGELPESAVLALDGTWRPAPSGDPASYATSLAFEIARLGGRDAASLAASLAKSLALVPWIESALPSGGYLTVTVTAQALASVAGRIVASGPACARSEVLAGSPAAITPWPDLAFAPSWQRAWQEQADAMAGRLAEAAGATAVFNPEMERGGHPTRRVPPDSPVQAAVAYFGVSAVRYRLARTAPAKASQLDQLSLPGHRDPDPLYALQQAHAEAASTLRWAAGLRIQPAATGEKLDGTLGAPSERELLGLLSWLQARVAAAARRQRPDELPRYLEDVARAWQACRQASPALPFGGGPVAEPAVAGARLLLADAVRAVLAAGLSLTGITASDRM